MRRRSVAAGDKRDETVIIGCYVDDLFVLYSHDDEDSIYHEFTTNLTKAWKAEDEGEVTDILNVEISAADGGVKLRQSNCIGKMVSAHLVDAHPPDSPPFSSKQSRTPPRAPRSYRTSLTPSPRELCPTPPSLTSATSL